MTYTFIIIAPDHSRHDAATPAEIDVKLAALRIKFGALAEFRIRAVLDSPESLKTSNFGKEESCQN